MKNRIMKGFIEEIRDKGMKFSMDDLAKRLGISKRTLYEHFSSKVEILETIIQQSFEEGDEKTQQILADDSLSLIDKIKGVMMVLPTHYEFYDLRILEQMKRYYPEQYAQVEASLSEDWQTLRVLLEQAIREGLIVNMDVTLMLKVIVDALNSTLDQRFYMKNQITVSEALSAIVDVLLFGLVPADKR
ncbi:TetR/AcrR family transcriptional regulator [Brevibacillus sp. M2.1A]|uniref:TetR/AcrR family transcriptional regulator n=2 Tax=Brevibacillus TaxID=55080 RepID=UPI001153C855|nr:MULTISPECIES: TetR/AcrR family transcriptional regulator [Brevibacillus]MCM3141583.1 TetR/AcrR family transcriptional regulator [Brevibacillus sp. MER 51]TQR39338.1 TetR/AcrR family transcriptional regulator [Lysinibacillus sp. SDF0063]MCC8435560.1 TetR/AcrR family transcriptional regulator [Brevibacillus sp. M2.1A]NQF17311.1 TetR/AcrR family transcriptional regulator [Brevibacillus sp. HB1.3]UKL01276.1 TetR/AcrR family transcriptional regulator [Brevibacillus brevis]